MKKIHTFSVDKHTHNADGTIYCIHPAHYLYALYNPADEHGSQQKKIVKHEHTLSVAQ